VTFLRQIGSPAAARMDAVLAAEADEGIGRGQDAPD
jgi:hypothetical protein